MTRPALFVEPCAGLANVSIRLAAGGSARGPVGRPGSKAKYADAILSAFGLAPGEGADQFLWAEADPAVRALLRSYPRPEVLSGAAEQIGRWVESEDPLVLWDRLRHAGPITESTPAEIARWVTIFSSNRLLNVSWSEAEQRFANTGKGGTTFGGPDFCNHELGRRGLERLVGIEWPEVEVRSAAGACLPSGDRDLDSRTVVFLDPPYRGTSGYGFEFGRREVVRLALRWAAAGALVGISEAEPIGTLVRLGWSVVDLTRKATGSRTQFSKQQREVLTLSRRPRPEPSYGSAGRRER